MGMPLYQPASYKDEAVLEEMRALDADLMIMAYVIIFIPGSCPRHPQNGLDLLPSLASAAASRPKLDQLADHLGLDQDRL